MLRAEYPVLWAACSGALPFWGAPVLRIGLVRRLLWGAAIAYPSKVAKLRANLTDMRCFLMVVQPSEVLHYVVAGCIVAGRTIACRAMRAFTAVESLTGGIEFRVYHFSRFVAHRLITKSLSSFCAL